MFRGNLQPTTSGFIINTYKTKTVDFPKTSLIFYQNIRRHMLEGCKLYTNHSEIFKSSTNPQCGFVGFNEGEKGPSFDYRRL
jgi:hypothetical protein